MPHEFIVPTSPGARKNDEGAQGRVIKTQEHALELPAISLDLFCQTCGYNLRGLTGNRCPECGASLGGVRSLVPQIPWVYRKDIGRWRAFWRTIRMVMFRQRQFCDEMARPVSYRDCQSFRWVTVGFVSIAGLLAIVATYITIPGKPFGDDFANAAFVAVWPVGVLYLCFVLFLAGATGVPSYFFHPRAIPVAQQNRAVALSYYACGPLVLLAASLLSFVLSLLPGSGDRPLGLLFTVCAFVLPIGAIAPWWLDLIHLSRRLMPQRPGRAVALGVLVPALWLVLGAGVFLGIPMFLLGVTVAVLNLM